MLALYVFAALVGQAACSTHMQHSLRGHVHAHPPIALIQRKGADLADEEAEKIQLEENLGESSDEDSGEADEDRLDWDEGDESIREMREEEEYSSFIQTDSNTGAKKAPIDDEMDHLQLEEEMGQSSSKDGGGDEERLNWDDDDECAVRD